MSVTRDLTTHPAWQEQDLGIPLPDSTHACSVCLPTWETIIGYEENLEKITKRLQLGYPRFFKHPAVENILDQARQELTSEGEDILLLPTRASAQRAHRWVEIRANTAIRTTSYHGLQALIVPAKAKTTANLYWRFSGEIVSSRQAIDFKNGTLREGSKSHLIARALTKFTCAKADSTFIFASGMAAATSVLRSLPQSKHGKKTLQIGFPYVDCLKIQESFGSGVVYLNKATGEPFAEALQRIRQGEFSAVFTEIPSNPLLATPDIATIASACKLGNTPLIIDDSATGPFNVHALKFADVVTSSLTKWISGMGDVMAGMATVNEESPFSEAFIASLTEESTHTAPLYISDAEILLSNLKSYGERMKTINTNGSELAAFLAQHPAVDTVWHPSITDTTNYDALKHSHGGYGGLLSFALSNPKKTPKVYDALQLNKGPSFGTPFTLVCPYTLLAHYDELDWAEGCGIPPHLLRVSCGLEPSETLIESFRQALENA